MKAMALLAAVVVALALSAAPVWSDDGADVNPNATGLFVSITDTQGGSSTQDTVADPANAIAYADATTVCARGGSQTCGEPALCDNGDIMEATSYFNAEGEFVDRGFNCPVDSAPAAAAPPQVTPGLVLAAFRRLPLPPSELRVQPPNGRTLVNFDTNFFTDGAELSRTVTLLGRRVELRIWPSQFGWRFGDGATRSTTSPGSAYPDLEITHRYLRAGRVAPSVDTTYAARFRVDGGPWRDVAGTVTIPGRPDALRVVTARPVLVGQ